jgi:hypothetical protein
LRPEPDKARFPSGSPRSTPIPYPSSRLADASGASVVGTGTLPPSGPPAKSRARSRARVCVRVCVCACVCVPGVFVIGALQVHQKNFLGGYYELAMLAVRLVGFRFKFVFDSPDLRSELLPCFTRDAYKLGRGTRWLELITVRRITIVEGVCTRTRSLETPNGSLCYKGSVHGVSGMNRCDIDDWQARIK